MLCTGDTGVSSLRGKNALLPSRSLLRRPRSIMKATIPATATTTPITIPAIAPPDIEDFPPMFTLLEGPTGAGEVSGVGITVFDNEVEEGVLDEVEEGARVVDEVEEADLMDKGMAVAVPLIVEHSGNMTSLTLAFWQVAWASAIDSTISDLVQFVCMQQESVFM